LAFDRPQFISRQVQHGDYFFLDLGPPPRSPLTVACGGRETCALNYSVFRERFPFHGIELVLAGDGELELQSRRFALRAGSVFTYGPRTQHRIRAVGKTALVKCFVDFTGPKSASLLRLGKLSVGDCVQLGRTQWVEQIFEQLLASGNEPKKFARRHCRLLLEALVSRLAIDAQPATRPALRSLETFERCRRYLDAHVLKLHTIRQAAAACGIDPAYFTRIFERYAGEPPYQNLIRRKMNKAAELLWHDQASVKQVAAALLYEDVFHFSRVFKRIYGMPPSKFRGAARALDRS
jgi:AraC-like DNA-binding protein